MQHDFRFHWYFAWWRRKGGWHEREGFSCLTHCEMSSWHISKKRKPKKNEVSLAIFYNIKLLWKYVTLDKFIQITPISQIIYYLENSSSLTWNSSWVNFVKACNRWCSLISGFVESGSYDVLKRPYLVPLTMFQWSTQDGFKHWNQLELLTIDYNECESYQLLWYYVTTSYF